MAHKTTKDVILDVIEDSVGSIIYYDRKEDNDLPVGKIQEAVSNAYITVDEMVAHFRLHLERNMY